MQTVRWLVHPVTFVGKVYETTRHTLSLKRLKQLMSLADRATEIIVVVDNQHRSLVLA